MNYISFIRLRSEDQAYHTLTHGIYLGTNNDGDDIYQLYDFWVSVQENSKGFYYEANREQPSFISSQMMRAQEL